MQNEYPSHIILKQEEIPSGKTNADLQNEYHTQPYLKKPEMPMSKFTKRIVPVLTIESASRHRFTHELNLQKTPVLQNECPRMQKQNFTLTLTLSHQGSGFYFGAGF